MGKFDKILEKLQKEAENRDAGVCKQKCPFLKKPAIYAVVLRSDTGAPVSGVKVDISKPTKQAPMTNGDGEIKVDPAKLGQHGVKVELTEQQKKQFAGPSPQSISTTRGHTSIVYFVLEPLPKLQVEVRSKSDKKPINGLRVQATCRGKQTVLTTSAGKADFGQLPAGAYLVTVTPERPPATKAEVFVEKASLNNFERGHSVVWDVLLPYGENKAFVVELDIVKVAKLRIVLFDKEGKPIPDKEWEMTAPVAARGKTAGNGLIEAPNLLVASTSGTLKVNMGLPTPTPKKTDTPPTVAVSDPPLHPPPIKVDDFKEKKPPMVPVPDGFVEWNLTIKLPDECKDDPSIKLRLHNMGFACDDSSDSPTTERAVKGFQSLDLGDKAPSGNFESTKTKITDRHDKA